MAMVITKYDFCLAPGHDGLSMEADKVDKFTAFPGLVPLLFQRIES
mgnify:CR=1 FL=1